LKASGDLTAILEVQQRAWQARPLLRRLYRSWYADIQERLSPVGGPTVELGAGFGSFKAFAPEVVATDVEATPWVDEVVDAEALPYTDRSIANLVLVDVFHHLARPARFLDEAQRALAAGGRVVILDPYCSPVSNLAYKWFHHERTDLAGAALEDDLDVAGSPIASNQARATLVFFRNAGEVRERWPGLRLVERRQLALFAYPLSGGFSGRRLTPSAAYPVLAAAEKLLAPLAPLMAFRCLVVLERQPEA
jgi:SAM-dependent methyltransferase